MQLKDIEYVAMIASEKSFSSAAQKLFISQPALSQAIKKLEKELGVLLFDSPLAGHFIATLGFICPFMYLDTTLSSILQGLGMAGRIFIMNVICLLLRLAFVFFAIPTFGITGYLWGMLASQLVQSVLYLGCLYLFLRRAEKENASL